MSTRLSKNSEACRPARERGDGLGDSRHDTPEAQQYGFAIYATTNGNGDRGKVKRTRYVATGIFWGWRRSIHHNSPEEASAAMVGLIRREGWAGPIPDHKLPAYLRQSR